MKRLLAVVGMILFIVAGCTMKNDGLSNEKEEIKEEFKEEIRHEIEQLQVDSKAFRYVVDWLSNEEILFVEEVEGISQLKAFHIKTKEITTIYEEQEFITNVIVHPMKEHLLIHTSVNDLAATIKIMTLDGVVQNELVLESTELEIEWNDVNPLHLLFTTFYEDWSFDTLYFNCSTDELHMIHVEDPFPKWFGPERFIILSNETGLGEVVLHQIETDEKNVIGRNVLQFSTFQNSLFFVETLDDERIRYAVVNTNDDLLAEGFTKFEEYDVDALQSTIEWLGEDELLLIQPSSEVEGVTAQYDLFIVNDDGLHVFMNDVVNAPIMCSPDGTYCLTGTHFEQLIHMKTKESNMWLIYDDASLNSEKQ